MADAPWRCSECGTINEPVANSCRTCGRWPSLFDLQESVLDEEPTGTVMEHPGLEAGTFEPQTFEVEQAPEETMHAPELTVERDGEPEGPADRRRRIITSLIVPLAFVVYIVISILFGDRGS